MKVKKGRGRVSVISGWRRRLGSKALSTCLACEALHAPLDGQSRGGHVDLRQAAGGANWRYVHLPFVDVDEGLYRFSQYFG